MADFSTLYCSVTEAYNGFEKAALACNKAQMVSFKTNKALGISPQSQKASFHSRGSLLKIQLNKSVTKTNQLKWNIIISKENDQQVKLIKIVKILMTFH